MNFAKAGVEKISSNSCVGTSFSHFNVKVERGRESVKSKKRINEEAPLICIAFRPGIQKRFSPLIPRGTWSVLSLFLE